MQAEDLSGVLDIQRLSFGEDLIESDEVIHQRFARFGGDFLVIKDGANIAGYALCFPWKLGDVPAHNKPFADILPEADSFFLQDISLHHDYRGRGLAGDLLQNIYSRAKEKGFIYLALVAVAQSGDYWDRQGFTEFAELPPEKQDYIKQQYGKGARLMLRCV